MNSDAMSVATMPQAYDQMPTLKKMNPTKAWKILSGPCEEKAAGIRNKTVQSMIDQDIGDVAYRFLQSRDGERNSFKEGAIAGTISVGLTTMNLLCGNSIPIVLLSMAQFVFVPPAFSNYGTYKETRKAAQAWLSERLGNAAFSQIEELSYNNDGLEKLQKVLSVSRVNFDSVQKKIRDSNEQFKWFSYSNYI